MLIILLSILFVNLVISDEVKSDYICTSEYNAGASYRRLYRNRLLNIGYSTFNKIDSKNYTLIIGSCSYFGSTNRIPEKFIDKSILDKFSLIDKFIYKTLKDSYSSLSFDIDFKNYKWLHPVIYISSSAIYIPFISLLQNNDSFSFLEGDIAIKNLYGKRLAIGHSFSFDYQNIDWCLKVLIGGMKKRAEGYIVKENKLYNIFSTEIGLYSSIYLNAKKYIFDNGNLKIYGFSEIFFDINNKLLGSDCSSVVVKNDANSEKMIRILRSLLLRRGIKCGTGFYYTY